MTQIVLSDNEIRAIGVSRWNDLKDSHLHVKNGTRFALILAFGSIFTLFGIKLASYFPNTPVGAGVALVICIGVIAAYVRLVITPSKKAGEEFLKEYRKQ